MSRPCDPLESTSESRLGEGDSPHLLRGLHKFGTVPIGFRTGSNWLLVLVCLALVCSSGLTRPARADRETIRDVQVGFAGKYKVGYWTPVRLRLNAGNENGIPVFSLVVPDGDGVPSRVQLDDDGVPITVPGQEVTCHGFVKFGQAGDTLQVETRDGRGRELTETLRQGTDRLANPLPPGRELVVLVGGAAGQAKGAGDDKDWQAEVARLGRAEELPSEWYGYEGVDRLVLLTEQPEIYRQLSAEQVAALERWVRLGGRLILSVGKAGADVLAEGQPLARFAPGRFVENLPLRQSTALEAFAGTNDRLDRVLDQQGNFRLDVPKLSDVRGKIESYEGNHPRDLPLAIRAPWGLGEVVFVAVDLDRLPLTRWRGRAPLVDRLMHRPELADEGTDQRVLGRVTELGYNDLVGQLQLALAQFAGVALIPFAAVAALVAVYILAIGPLDYLFLKKIVGRMELTWVTFPAIVLAFSGGTYALAHWLKGSQLRINQVDLVDVDAETETARGTSWATLYSPRIDTFDLTPRIDPSEVNPAEPPRALLSWLASGGSGLAGAGRAAGSAMFTHPYDFSRRLDAVEHLPLAAWSTRSLLTRWWAKASGSIEARLSDHDHFLAGTLKLPAVWPLTDCVLVYDRWAYPLRLGGGETIDVERDLEPQTIETYFRHVTIIEEKSRRTPYDRASTNLAEIVETMMFHDLVGGEVYTRLSGQSQNYVDLSGLIELGRAILVGRSTAPATTLLRTDGGAQRGDAAAQPGEAGGKADAPAGRELIDPAGQRLTFYRFVLPVAPSGGQ